MKETPISIEQIENACRVSLKILAPSQACEKFAHSYKLDENGQIIELNLDDCGIDTLKSLSGLTYLKRLSIKHNNIDQLSYLSRMRSLVYLNMSHNRLEDISPLKALNKLRYLNISFNHIYDLSPLFNQLKTEQLEELNIMDNPLIYPSVGACEKGRMDMILWFEEAWSYAREEALNAKKYGVKSLDLGNCGLTDLSHVPELFECTQLETLILSNEWSTYEPDGWRRMTSGNKWLPNNLFHIPKDLSKLVNLKTLIVGGDWKGKKKPWNRWRIRSFSLFTSFKKLEILNISNNLISGIVDLQNLRYLKVLHVNNNMITSVKVSKELNTFLERHTNMTKTTIAPAMRVRRYLLEEINISNNLLKDISFLKRFPHLITADVHANKLTDLYHARKVIQQLGIADSKWQKGTLNVAQNPLDNPKPEVISQGAENVLAYFKQYEAEQAISLPVYTNTDIKLILVGNSNAGKSTLAEYLITGRFDDTICSTHWMDVRSWTVTYKKKHFKIRIFDFGGQEYYHDTHHLFFTRQTAYVLLWDKQSNTYSEIDITQRQADGSTETASIQGYPLNYWLDSISYHTNNRHLSADEARIAKILDDRDEEISQRIKVGDDWGKAISSSVENIQKEMGEGPNMLVVQNKVDNIADTFFLDQQGLKNNYSGIYDYANISIKALRGITHFKSLLFEMLETIPIMDREFLGSWGAIKDDIEKKTKAYNEYLSIEGFKKYCNTIIGNIPQVKKVKDGSMNSVLFNDTDVRSFAQYLNDIGLILYFPENEALKDRVFINQDKILKKIYDILLGLDKRKGTFSHEHILDVLKKTSFDAECQVVLDLMTHFKIVFPHPSVEHTYIAPLYLPSKPLKEINIFLNTSSKPTYRFQFNSFIHKHIILEFFQAYGRKALKGSDDESYYYWRNGIVMKNEDSHEIVMVKFCNGSMDSSKAHIDVFNLNHPSGTFFLNDIANELEKICINKDVIKAVTLDGQSFVPLTVIRQAEEKQHWVFQYDNNYYKLTDFKSYLKDKMKMKKVFISYSKADVLYLTKLENHLSVLKRNGMIDTWNCRKLLAGEKWDGKIKQELEEADIIIFLVSDDFLATDYIWDIEIKRAIEREDENPSSVKVIPIIVRSCYWEGSPLAVYSNAAYKAQPLTLAGDIDDAYKKVVTKIIEVINHMN